MTKLAALTIFLPAVLAASSPTLDGGIHLDVVNGFPVITAVIDGQGPLRLLLDTGAQACTLAPKAARKLGLEPDERVVLSTSVGDRLVPARKSTAIRVGSVEFGGVEVLISSVDALQQAGVAADGVLGQSFLRKTPYLIDFGSSRLYLGDLARQRSETLGDPLNGRMTADRVSIEVHLDPARAPYLMTLDSGASNLVLWCRTGCPGRSVESAYSISTMTGSSSAQVRELAGIRVGKSQMGRQNLVVLPGERNAPEDGLLPARLFQQIYVDAAQAVVRVR